MSTAQLPEAVGRTLQKFVLAMSSKEAGVGGGLGGMEGKLVLERDIRWAMEELEKAQDSSEPLVEAMRS